MYAQLLLDCFTQLSMHSFNLRVFLVPSLSLDVHLVSAPHRSSIANQYERMCVATKVVYNYRTLTTKIFSTSIELIYSMRSVLSTLKLVRNHQYNGVISKATNKNEFENGILNF